MFTFHRFAEIDAESWLGLLTDTRMHRHMPLAGGEWTLESAAEWAQGKDAQWAENGYGPWAVKIAGTFAGWAGFQREGEDADLGLVLLPAFWGYGRRLHDVLVDKAFRDLSLPSIIVLLPPTRGMARSLGRLGYRKDGETDIAGHRFLRYRLRCT